MIAMELYINGQLCDIGNPHTFSVYLKRHLLNPSQLNTKDAQRSYDISLPASATNTAILGYINTEEVGGKFVQLYDARLIVGGEQVFEGKFKISEITKRFFKGNLGIPKVKTAKDIFGETKMSEMGEWKIQFEDFHQSINNYNTGNHPVEYGKYSPCIFPLVLYGLLPKDNRGIYSAKDKIDDSVNLSVHDVYPSVNCLKTFEQIFKNYKLSGSAFDDERLAKLYMSYKNPDDYTTLWNAGGLGKILLDGKWSNFVDHGNYECKMHENNEDGVMYCTNLFDSTSSVITKKQDELNCVYQSDDEEEIHGKKVRKTKVTIPQSGYYKVHLKAEITLKTLGRIQERISGHTTILSALYADSNYRVDESFYQNCYELKLLRHAKDDQEYDISTLKYDNSYCKDNQPIDKDSEVFPKYFPAPNGVNLIDAKQNPNFVCGFAFGNYRKRDDNYPHVLRGDSYNFCQPMALKGGKSWNTETNIQYSIVDAPNYYALNEDDTYQGVDLYPTKMLNGETSYVEITETLVGLPMQAKGDVYQVIWFEQGDVLTMVTNSFMGQSYKDDNCWGWVAQNIDFELVVSPYKVEKGWLSFDEYGKLVTVPSWNEPSSFLTNEIDLAKFLPINVKIDDWIINFCKVFNLELIQIGIDSFALNVKKNRNFNTSLILDLDAKTNVDIGRINTSLALPSVYKLGFKVEDKEQGKIENEADGDGVFKTGSIEDTEIQEQADFSYNWFKKMMDMRTPGKYVYLPLISEAEVWSFNQDYHEMKGNKYTDLSQRFWYQKENDGLITVNINEKEAKLSLVANELHGAHPSVLDYEDKPNSILTNYFTLFTNPHVCYTTVECCLTPQEYGRVDCSLARLNGDIYYIAEVDGYDPSGRRKAKLKLIKKEV